MSNHIVLSALLEIINVFLAAHSRTMLEAELSKMNPDMGAIEAFKLKDAEFNDRVAELEACSGERDKVSKATGQAHNICEKRHLHGGHLKKYHTL